MHHSLKNKITSNISGVFYVKMEYIDMNPLLLIFNHNIISINSNYTLYFICQIWYWSPPGLSVNHYLNYQWESQ